MNWLAYNRAQDPHLSGPITGAKIPHLMEVNSDSGRELRDHSDPDGLSYELRSSGAWS